jgi:hypothetical protein
MHGPTEPVTVSGPGAGRAVRQVLWTLVALIAIAILKPWGSGPSSPPGVALPPTFQPLAVFTPTPRPTTELDAVASFCLEPSGWRVYSAERWAGQDVRAWTAVHPVTFATDAIDPRIPIIPVVSHEVQAIGFCAPIAGAEKPPPDATDRMYQLIAVAIQGQRLIRAVPMTPTRIAPAGRASYLGASYVPRPGSTWSSGSYVIHIEGSGYSRWFGIQVEILHRRTGT